MVVYSTAPVHFHIVTDGDSVDVIRQIMKRAERQANCRFAFTVDTIGNIFDDLFNHLERNVPDLKLPLLKQHVATRLLPLVLPWHFNNIRRIIYLDSNIKLRADITELYEFFQRFQGDQVMGLTLAQNRRFESAFAVHRHLSADKTSGKYLGLSSPQGWPGFNADILLMDLQKMRASPLYRRYVDVQNQWHIVKKYKLSSREALPGLDEWLTLVGLESAQLFHTLPCEWNTQHSTGSNSSEQCNNIKAMAFVE